MTEAVASTRGDLALLLCGKESADKAPIDEVLDHIAEGVSAVFDEIKELKNQDDRHVMLYGPFLGRSILEIGCTSIIARLDPFRILLLRERQKQPSFSIDKPHKSSIRWQGDVMSEKVGNLWDERSLQNPTRALLGDYFAELIWNKNINTVLDSIDSTRTGSWFDQLRQFDSASLCAKIRGSLANLYSSLSKGIHHELVIPMTSSFDRSTVVELINDSVYNVASLGLITHAVKHSYNCAEIITMIECYNRLQSVEAM